jgi:hypothetical protein
VSATERYSPFWTQDNKTVEVTVTNHGLPPQVFKTRTEDIRVVSRFTTKKMSRLFMRQQPTRDYSTKQTKFYDNAYYWARDFKQTCDVGAYLDLCYKTSMTKAWMAKLEEGDPRLGGIKIKPHTRTFNRLCGTNWWIPQAMVPIPKGVDRRVYTTLADEVYEEHSRRFGAASRFVRKTFDYLETVSPEDFLKCFDELLEEISEARQVIEEFESALSFYEA